MLMRKRQRAQPQALTQRVNKYVWMALTGFIAVAMIGHGLKSTPAVVTPAQDKTIISGVEFVMNYQKAQEAENIKTSAADKALIASMLKRAPAAASAPYTEIVKSSK